MANLVRRENRDVTRQEGSEQRWDPLRMMAALLRWAPFRLDGNLPVRGDEFIPRFDIKDTKTAYELRADLPGVKDEDLDVQVNGSILSISGKREDEQREEGDRYYALERSYGTFTRSFALPDGIDPDGITADLKSGVLMVHIPTRPEPQPKKIQIARERDQGNQGKNNPRA